MLEEDLALPNIALDLIGQARVLYTYAGEVEGQGRDEDALAYLRLERGYVNALICEKENGDFAQTMFRLLVFSTFMGRYWAAAKSSPDATIAGDRRQGRKGNRLSHPPRRRMGDPSWATAPRKAPARMAEAVIYLAPYVGELFEADDISACPRGCGKVPFPILPTLKNWLAREDMIHDHGRSARLDMPDLSFAHTGGRQGVHTEEMGHLLAELQYMQRAYPGMEW